MKQQKVSSRDRLVFGVLNGKGTHCRRFVLRGVWLRGLLLCRDKRSRATIDHPHEFCRVGGLGVVALGAC